MLLSVSLTPNGTPSAILKVLRQLNSVTSAKIVTEKQVVSGGMHRPVCPECECELHPETNGMGVLDFAEFGPYELWDSDLWKCPKCGKKVIGGFGAGPLCQHNEPNFQFHINHYKKLKLLVNNNG